MFIRGTGYLGITKLTYSYWILFNDEVDVILDYLGYMKNNIFAEASLKINSVTLNCLGPCTIIA